MVRKIALSWLWIFMALPVLAAPQIEDESASLRGLRNVYPSFEITVSADAPRAIDKAQLENLLRQELETGGIALLSRMEYLLQKDRRLDISLEVKRSGDAVFFLVSLALRRKVQLGGGTEPVMAVTWSRRYLGSCSRSDLSVILESARMLAKEFASDFRMVNGRSGGQDQEALR